MRFHVFLRGRRRAVRVVLPLVAVIAAALVAVGVGSATPPGTNGQITFARFNPTLGDTQIYVVNPDGTGQRLVQASFSMRRVDKLGVTGSSPVPPMIFPAKRLHASSVLLTKTVSQVLVK
jgi:hypothetical protein